MTDIATPRREDLPDGSVRIVFAAPILHFTDPKGAVTLRQPTVAELLEIGDPRAYLFNDAGQGMPYVDREKLVQWIGRLMVDHDPDMIGRERDVALGMLIEEAILGFFLSARKRLTTASAPSSVAA